MMNEKLKDFFKKLIKDEAFREEFASAKTAYDGYTMAKPYIEGVSFDEFKDGLTYIHNKIEYRKELLNGGMSKISGGTNEFSEVLFLLSQYKDSYF